MNLLFLYTDEQAVNTLAAYGNDLIYMPNLNRLAAESTVFNQAYVTQPVCTPSRSSLLTGLWPHTTGCVENNIVLPVSTPCLPELLQKKNYQTAHFGKWHLGDEVFRQHSFDEWVSIEDSYFRWFTDGRDKATRSDYDYFLRENGFIPANGDYFDRAESAAFSEKFSKPAFLAKESIEFIERNQNNPFILYVNFLEPHMPFSGPRDEQYDPSMIPLPKNFEHQLDSSNPIKARLMSYNLCKNGYQGNDLLTPEGWQKLKAKYWGLCSQVDTHIGRILDKLRECDLYDDTLIIFTSDHGDMMGSHQLLTKGVMFEEAVRVPFLLKAPQNKTEKRVDGPVSQLDIIPTILDFLGEDIPDSLQGKSLKKISLTGGQVADDNDVFIEWTGGSRKRMLKDLPPDIKIDDPANVCSASIRTVITPSGWKLNWSTKNEDELYNLNNDPFEKNNLIGEVEYLEIISELRCKITKWQNLTKDSLTLKTKEISV